MGWPELKWWDGSLTRSDDQKISGIDERLLVMIKLKQKRADIYGVCRYAVLWFCSYNQLHLMSSRPPSPGKTGPTQTP